MAVLGYTYHLSTGPDAKGNRAPFRFKYVHEWDLRDFDWWFLFACHGVAWGIAQYDAVTAAKQVAA